MGFIWALIVGGVMQSLEQLLKKDHQWALLPISLQG